MAVKNTFKKGDVVRLKSGGPPMTVTHELGELEDAGFKGAWVGCAWFAEEKFEKHGFVPESLQPFRGAGEGRSATQLPPRKHPQGRGHSKAKR